MKVSEGPEVIELSQITNQNMGVIKEIQVEKHEPVVIDNDYISILKHNFILKMNDEKAGGRGISFRFKNISGSDIGKAVFEIIFYDAKGNVLESIEKSTSGFEKEGTRILDVETSKSQEVDISNYDVKIAKVIFPPAPVATGNDQIKIVKHCIGSVIGTSHALLPISCLHFAIRNISSKTISTAIFDITFYDGEANELETVRHKELYLKPNDSRAIAIKTDKIIGGPPRSYNITLIKAITTDVERIQMYRNEVNRFEMGGQEICGILKNISDIKSDAALVATFFNHDDAVIGKRILLIKDISPNSIKKFSFTFIPPEGEEIKNHKFDIGELIEADIKDYDGINVQITQ
jgi:hypothetical protein